MLLGVISLVSISTMIFFTRFRLIAVERRGIAGEQDYSSSSSSPFMMMLLQEEQLQSEFIRHDTNTNKNNNNKIVQKPKAKFRFGTSRLIHDDNNNNNNNNNNKDDPDTLHEVEHVNLRNAKIAKKLIEYERISEHRATRQEQALISKQQQEYETKHLAPPPPETPPIHFLTFAQLDLQDTFSATWIQRRREFMQMEMDKVIICEDAAFKAWQYRKHRLRMTADYMDLSVEHLSKWWKLLTVHKTESAYNKLMDTLQEYIRKGVQFPTPAEPLFERMIVVIAFQPYDHKDKHDEHYMLTVSNLASTIESLRRAQMGRVVVMGMNADDKEYLKDAVEYVLMNNPTLSRGVDGKSITKLGHMEVAYVQGEAAWGKTKYLERNVPRAALLGVKKAFELIDSKSLLENMTEEEHNFVVSWLGKTHQQRQPEYWKYLMLTEPDTLLQIRPTSIRHIKDQLDQGRILAPHRLQPIPHESDVPDLKNPYRFLNKDNGWNNVYELDPNNFARGTEYTDVCCDEYGGPKAKPGKANYTDCGTWWYACGFDIDYHKALEDPHKRLRPYSLMKLKQGTGLTLIAGTLMGRRCFPATSIDQCAPPLHTESPLGDGIPAEREVAQHDHTLHGPQHDHEYHATSSLSIRQVNENAQSAYSPFEDRKDYVVRRNPNTDPNPEPVFFLNFTQLALQDTFSASWFQRKKEFMEMDLEKVAICEDAAFKAWDSRRGKLRMTYDYMDLSVEHLSKWWKLLTVHNTVSVTMVKVACARIFEVLL